MKDRREGRPPEAASLLGTALPFPLSLGLLLCAAFPTSLGLHWTLALIWQLFGN